MSTSSQSVTLTVIGTIRTDHFSIENMPIQSVVANEYGVAEVYPEFEDGLLDLDGFSHAILLYHLHRQKGFQLRVKPFMDDKEHGVFATRSPKRPAAIGLSIVKINSIEGNKIRFEGADMLDGSPLIDIKPFFKTFDNRTDAISGWLEGKDEKSLKKIRSDDRFK